MSTTTPISPIPSTFSSTTTTTTTTTNNVGLGYGIAIAISILVLISTIMLVSYACIRIKAGGQNHDADADADDDEDEDEDEDEDRSQQPVVNRLPGPMLIKVGWEKQPKKEVSYPQVMLGESKRLPKPNTGPCSICLAEYKAKEIVRCMPECNHCFHVKCIDQWLKMNPTCPLCRSSPAVTPARSSPLPQFVPMTSHPR